MSGEEIHFYDWQVRGGFPYDWLAQQDFVDISNEPTEPDVSQKSSENNLEETSNVTPIASHPEYTLYNSSEPA